MIIEVSSNMVVLVDWWKVFDKVKYLLIVIINDKNNNNKFLLIWEEIINLIFR